MYPYCTPWSSVLAPMEGAAFYKGPTPHVRPSRLDHVLTMAKGDRWVLCCPQGSRTFSLLAVWSFITGMNTPFVLKAESHLRERDE